MNINRDFTEKELAWLNKFEKIMSQAPDSLFMFIGEGFTVYVTDEDKKRFIVKGTGGVDSTVTARSIKTNIQYDGGGY